MKKQSSNLRFALLLLDREKREAMKVVYAFCRYTDDLVDEGDIPASTRKQHLDAWRAEVELLYLGKATNPVMAAMAPVVSRYKIPKELLLALIDGCEMDLDRTRYQTFEELESYCYRVASIVGLISIEIFGYKSESTKDYAINLGYALQLTNILRDIGEDAARGRIYLPLADIARFAYTEKDLIDGVYDDRFVRLMEFEAKRATEFYEKARASLKRSEYATLFPSRIMDATYSSLLSEIRNQKFNVFKRRISVSSVRKLYYLLRYWLLRYV